MERLPQADPLNKSIRVLDHLDEVRVFGVYMVEARQAKNADEVASAWIASEISDQPALQRLLQIRT